MIVFKNYFERTYTKSDDDFKEPMYFQINNTNMKITKNYPQLHEIINNIKISQNKSEIYKILIPNLVQNKIITKDDYDEDYISYEDKYSSVTISNYDRQDIYQEQKSNSYERDLFYQNFNRPQTNNYYFENDDENTNNISPIIDHQHNTMIKKYYLPRNETESSIEVNSFAYEQFQLILDGYDIIIPDFLVDDMIKIAEKFQINELFDAIDPLKEQIKDLE